jgi:hypothetical protein
MPKNGTANPDALVSTRHDPSHARAGGEQRKRAGHNKILSGALPARRAFYVNFLQIVASNAGKSGLRRSPPRTNLA